MRLASADQIRQIEEQIFQQGQFSPIDLMEMATYKMAESLVNLPGLGIEHKLCFICGPGNNGGDGFSLANRMWEKGFKNIKVFYYPGPHDNNKLWQKQFAELPSDFEKVNLKTLLSAGHKISFRPYDLLIDALFGIGLNRQLNSEMIQIISAMNKSGNSILSLDVPSGLDADTGNAYGAVVHATMTLTCGLAKPGFFLNAGPANCGKLKVLDIGFPREIVLKNAKEYFLIGQSSAKKLQPRRVYHQNKSSFGKLLIVAGSPGLEGAAVMAGIAAARMGAGYVCMASQSEGKFFPPDFLRKTIHQLLEEDLTKYSCVLVGPGLVQDLQLSKLLHKLKDSHTKVILDAEAMLVTRLEKLWPLPKTWLLLPHAGELSKLIDTKAKEIELNRLQFIARAEQAIGASILLKGFRTCIRSDNKTFIVNSGNVALAKAGTGDVLAGMVSAYVAQGLGTAEAACLGAFKHGLLADSWIKKGFTASALMASDLLKMI